MFVLNLKVKMLTENSVGGFIISFPKNVLLVKLKFYSLNYFLFTNLRENFMKIVLALILSIHCFTNAYAEVYMKDVGIVGLMSHDIFAWDHKKEINTENGRLDLSTIFEFDNGSRWEKGGNPKNSENSPVYTVTMMLVDYYKSELKKHGAVIARKKTIVLFHGMIRESFERLSGLDFPDHGLVERANNTEQAALRGMHDILPGTAKLYDRPLLKEFTLTNPVFAKLRLNAKELNQTVAYFDGDYAPEFQNIKIPFTKKIINLKEIDRKFIAKFSPYTQEDMLNDLREVGLGNKEVRDVFFVHHLWDLVAKGICPVGNQWMPQGIECK